jgi:hypothetical protein
VKHTARVRTITLVATTCAAAIAACGSERPAGTASASADQALTYVRCLRSHGVPDFPDPGPDGRLPNIPSSIDTAAPAFQSAERTCAGLAPGVGGSGSASGSFTAGLLAVARCMRAHGLPGFPDPTTTPPPAPPPGAHAGNVIGGPGAYLHLPPPSPALTHAAAACGLPIR